MHETAANPMPLLTPNQHEQLLANSRQRDRDHVPVVKFFNPIGIGTCLATELDADSDMPFGLVQLNDVPELGSFSLEELSSLRLPFGMHIERDIFFTGAFPISAYADAAGKPAASQPRSASFPARCGPGTGRGHDAFPPLAKTRALSRYVA